MDIHTDALPDVDYGQLGAKLNELMQPVANNYASEMDAHIQEQLTSKGLSPEDAVLIWPTKDVICTGGLDGFKHNVVGNKISVNWALPLVISREEAESRWPQLAAEDEIEWADGVRHSVWKDEIGQTLFVESGYLVALNRWDLQSEDEPVSISLPGTRHELAQLFDFIAAAAGLRCSVVLTPVPVTKPQDIKDEIFCAVRDTDLATPVSANTMNEAISTLRMLGYDVIKKES